MNVLFKKKIKKFLAFFAISAITSLIISTPFISSISNKNIGCSPSIVNTNNSIDLSSQSNVQESSKSIKSSNVLSVPWAKTYFNGPFNADDFINNYEEFANQYMFPSVWDMEWGSTVFQNAVKNYIKSKAFYLPSGFAISDFILTNISANDSVGSLTISFLLGKYYDKNNNYKDTPPEASGPDSKPTPFTITIEGFKKSLGKTSLPSEYVLTENDSIYNNIYDPSLDTEIKKIISKKIINSPINFELESNNKYINFIIKPNKEKAYVDVSVSFQGFFDSSGTFFSGEYFNSTIRIKGFKSSILTEINTSNLRLGDPSEIAQIASNAAYIIENIIIKNNLIVNPSPTFNEANIIVDDIVFNNKEGTINFNITLNKYTNNNGEESTEGFVPLNLTIDGFKKVNGSTRFNSTTYEIANSFQNAYDFVTDPKKIIDLITPHLLNKVQEYSTYFPATKLSIKEESIILKSEEGKISFVPIIKNYFDGNTLNFISSTKELDQIEISGFRRIGETRINENANFVLGNSNILPSFFFENEMDTLKSYVLDRLVYKPDSMKINDIIIDDNSTYSNIDGTITLYVRFGVWYDANGALQTTPSTVVNKVVISGFRKVSATSIITTFSVSEYNLLPSDVIKNEDYVKQLVIDNLINNIVSNTTKNNIVLTNLSADNLLGNISFNISLNKYYTDDGLVYDGPDYKFWPEKVTISGFKTVLPTKLPSNSVWKTDLIDSLAETVSKDIEYLKNFVYQKITGSIPNGFSISKNIVIENITFSNVEGKINFDVNFTLFYDDYGNIQTSFQSPYNITITDFRKINPTNVVNVVNVVGYSNVLPSDISKTELIDIIFNNYSSFYENLPINYFNKENIIIEGEINAINSLGSIDILLSTTTYYDLHGNLVLNSVSNKLEPKKVTILGFNSITETVINSGVSIPGVSNVFPSDVSDSMLLDYLYINRDIIFTPIPDTFSKNSITISNQNQIIRDNLEGSITFDVSIINYYNSLGLVETSIPKTIYRFVLTGFKSSSPTTFDSQVTLPIEDVGNLLASNVSNEQLLGILKKNKYLFVRSYPAEFEIESIDILKNSTSNLIGSLIVEINYINFYDNNGVISSSPQTTSLRCYGFKKVSPTQINPEFFVNGKNDVLPSSQSETEIKNIIINNKDRIFVGLPEGITDDEIVISVDKNSYINSQGQIVVNISLNKYYDDASNLVVVSPQNPNAKPLTSEVILSGFLSISPTTIKEKVLVLDDLLINKFATDITEEELVKYVFNNRNSIISSIPEGFSENNITISEPIYSNSQGIIVAKISLSLYYDSSSQLATSGFEPKTIIFEGFTKNNKVTYVQPTLFLDSPLIQTQPAHTITYAKFLDYVFENNLIKNTPPTFTRSDLLPGTSENFVEIGNLDGYVTAKVFIKNYYDFQGNIINDPSKPLICTITIYGFRKTLPTEVISFYKSESFSHRLASEETEENLLKLVKNSSGVFIDKEPSIFNPQKDIIKLEIIDKSNLTGQVNALLYINNYYDSTGNIFSIDDPNDPNQLNLLKTWNITFSGYKILSPTNINKYFVSDTYTNTLPTHISNEEVKEIIFNNRNSIFNNLPSTGITLSDFDVNIINTSNLDGEITVHVKLYKYINSLGNLVTKETTGLSLPIKQNILIKGFKAVTPTTVIPEISAIDLNSPIANLLPYRINKIHVTRFITENQKRILFNLPVPLINENFSSANIISLTPSNNAGLLKVKFSVKNYYNNLGELVLDAPTNNEKIFEFNIIDLAQTGATSAINYFSVPFISSEKTPQELYLDKDYLSSVVMEYKEDIFNNLPANFYPEDLVISNQSFSNIDGTISFDMSLSKYYDKDGSYIVSNTNQKFFSITLGGYKTTDPTLFNSQIDISGYENVSPSDFIKSTTDFRDLIFENRSLIFSNLSSLSSFTKDSIFIKAITPFDSSGKIVIDYSINNYYDTNGILTSELSEKKQLTIVGFFSNPITSIIQNVQVNYKNMKPSNFFEQSSASKEYQIQKFVFDNQNLFFENLPVGKDAITINDVIISNNSVFANDKEGYIKFSLSLAKYYDSFGVLQTTPSPLKQIIITGFANQSPTSIGDFNTLFSKNGGIINATIGNDFLTVEEFLKDENPIKKIESLIVSSILNSGSNNNQGVLGFKSYDVDFKNGIIIVNDLRLTDFFDAESGQLVSDPNGVSFTLIINGFKTNNKKEFSTPEILIYVAIGITSTIILAIILFFIYKFIRHKYFKI